MKPFKKSVSIILLDLIQLKIATTRISYPQQLLNMEKLSRLAHYSLLLNSRFEKNKSGKSWVEIERIDKQMLLNCANTSS